MVAMKPTQKKNFPKLEGAYLGVLLSLIFTEYTTVKLLPEKKKLHWHRLSGLVKFPGRSG